MNRAPLPAIRRVGPGDAGRYAQAAERFFRQTYSHEAGHAAVMDSHCAQTYAPGNIRAQLAAADVTALVAEQEGVILGLAQMVAKNSEGEVQRFYVDAAWHGRGIAQVLMAALILRAEAGGLRALSLGVWTQNDRAIAFYQRQGFRPEGTVKFLLDGIPQSDLLMRRLLGPGAEPPRGGSDP
ncbi:MAG: GNAT family N-acetyltransferase [Rhodobacterales bacterium]|nr:GNAT family N-acetyltransferase [Rhodobacterales bacterium]